MRVTKVVSSDLSGNPGDCFLCSCKHPVNNCRISCCRWDIMAQAILPYCQALEKFAPHIQQFNMESKGKGVSIDGVHLPFEAGEIDFGEPDSNGQHNFYQLIHQVADMSSKCDYLQGWL
ncbi:glucose-6-phosphate isomerase, cytosolic 2B-like isoform X2 [Papaver somniferum]|uniref:glucose-6-phosphate isomerase, cytosolic 2B-like isoform X2 n=1 Tax=Papaver somniferum TaxID=3469 RepID=UPI000E705F0B|nr:glucose-6-phosphate isomerase, cytosolic 2B-like isoform X2 [Papaver somniferum]